MFVVVCFDKVFMMFWCIDPIDTCVIFLYIFLGLSCKKHVIFYKKIFYFCVFFCEVIIVFNIFFAFLYFFVFIEAFHLKQLQIASVRRREYWDYVCSYILAYIVSSLLCWYCNLSKREMFSVFFNFMDECFAFAYVFMFNCDTVDVFRLQCVLIKTDPPSALIWYATTCHQSKLSSSIGSYFAVFDVMNISPSMNGMENIVRRAAIRKI